MHSLKEEEGRRSAAWGMRFSTDASTEARCGDAAVAPIFFYNAMLGRVGELVGLTLFEPQRNSA